MFKNIENKLDILISILGSRQYSPKCKEMINNGTGNISYHDWNMKYSDACYCGEKNPKITCSKCKGTGKILTKT